MFRNESTPETGETGQTSHLGYSYQGRALRHLSSIISIMHVCKAVSMKSTESLI